MKVKFSRNFVSTVHGTCLKGQTLEISEKWYKHYFDNGFIDKAGAPTKSGPLTSQKVESVKVEKHVEATKGKKKAR
jgi:hypothetical protein